MARATNPKVTELVESFVGVGFVVWFWFGWSEGVGDTDVVFVGVGEDSVGVDGEMVGVWVSVGVG